MHIKKGLGDIVWWVVKTKPQQEFNAHKHLSQQGFTAFCPIFKKEIKQRSQFKIKTHPLFMGYLFIYADDFAKKNSHLIRSTKGLNALLKIGESILTVSPEIIQTLKLNQNKYISDVSPHFKSGSSVKIISGIYKGIDAIYQMDSGKDRAIILLSLIQNQTKLNLRKNDLIKN